MIRATVEIREEAVSRRVQINAPSIEQAPKIAGAGAPGCERITAQAIYKNQSASSELLRRTPVHGETNTNVAGEVARRRAVQDAQDGQSAKGDEPIASASAEEYDYIVINDMFVSGAGKTENSKKRTVYATRPERDTKLPAVISVQLDDDEDVEWTWTHTADGKSVVTGYIISKRTDKPRQRREVLDDSKGSSPRRSR